MTRSPNSRLIWLVLLMVGLFAAGALSQTPSPATLRARSMKLKNDGNFREAYDGLRRLCLDPNSGAATVSQDLASAVECLNNLGRIQEFDDLLEKTIVVHQQNWRLLQAAAQQYLSVEHNGFRIAGKFERGPHRGGGGASDDAGAELSAGGECASVGRAARRDSSGEGVPAQSGQEGGV